MREQTQFIRLFYKEELPFSRSAFQTVKKALTRKETDRYTLVAKTGLAEGKPTRLGWYVGYLLVYPPLPPDLPDSLRVKMPKPAPKGYYFATTIEVRNEEDIALREELTLEILRYLNLMPQ
jgi:beta-lactamase class D